MDIHEAATLTETFLQEHIDETANGAEFALVLRRVEVEGESTLRVVFGVGMVFRVGDHRAHERINRALRALDRAHPEVRDVTFEVTAESFDPDAS